MNTHKIDFPVARWVVNCEVWQTGKKKNQDRVGFKNQNDELIKVRDRISFHLSDVGSFCRVWEDDWTEPGVEEVKIFFLNYQSLNVIFDPVELQRRYNEYHMYKEFVESSNEPVMTQSNEKFPIVTINQE